LRPVLVAALFVGHLQLALLVSVLLLMLAARAYKDIYSMAA
jgi:hypothetical protein